MQKVVSRAVTVLAMGSALIAYTNCKASGALVAFYGYGFTCNVFAGLAVFKGPVEVRTSGNPNDNTYVSVDDSAPITVSYACSDFKAKDGTDMVSLGTLAFSAGGEAGRALVRAEVALGNRTVSDCSSTNACAHALRDIPIIANTDRNVSMTVYAKCSGGTGVCQKNGTTYQTCVDANARNGLTTATAGGLRLATIDCRNATIGESQEKIDEDPDEAVAKDPVPADGKDPPGNPGSGSASSSGDAMSGSSGSSSTTSSGTTSSSTSTSSSSTSGSSTSTSSSTSSASSSSSTSSASSSSTSTSSSSSSGVMPGDGGIITVDDGGGGVAVPH